MFVSSGPDDNRGHLLVEVEDMGSSKDQVQDPQLVVIKIPDHQFILPKNVCFKGDNGKFLGVQLVHEHWIDNNNYLQFSSTDISDPNARHTICTNESDGTIRIKTDGVGMFWRRHPEWQWIWPDSSETDASDTEFRVIEWGDNQVVLQHIESNLICRRQGEFEGKTDCLRADASDVCDAARLWVHEPVSHRKLYNVKYHLTDAIIRERQMSLPVATTHSSNHSSVANTATLTLKYSYATHATWNTSIKKHSIGIKTSVHANLVKVNGFGFDGGANFEYDNTTSEFKFRELHDHTVEQKIDINITVPPNTKVTVHARGSRSSYDVPFSCDQEDTLLNGQIVTSKVEDGVFHGACSHDFTYVVTEEKLPPNDEPSKNAKQEEPADAAKETAADGLGREDDVEPLQEL